MILFGIFTLMNTGGSRFLRHVGSYIHYTVYNRKRTAIIWKMIPRKFEKICVQIETVGIA